MVCVSRAGTGVWVLLISVVVICSNVIARTGRAQAAVGARAPAAREDVGEHSRF